MTSDNKAEEKLVTPLQYVLTHLQAINIYFTWWKAFLKMSIWEWRAGNILGEVDELEVSRIPAAPEPPPFLGTESISSFFQWTLTSMGSTDCNPLSSASVKANVVTNGEKNMLKGSGLQKEQSFLMLHSSLHQGAEWLPSLSRRLVSPVSSPATLPPQDRGANVDMWHVEEGAGGWLHHSQVLRVPARRARCSSASPPRTHIP